MSLSASVAAIISWFFDLTPGMNPRPVEPIAGIVLGLVTATAIVGFLLFTWGIRHI